MPRKKRTGTNSTPANPRTGRLTQGSVAWAAYPLTGSADQRRPVLILSNGQADPSDDEYVVVPITRTLSREPFTLAIQPGDVEGDESLAGEIRCSKPFTIPNAFVRERIGTLDPDMVEQVVAALYASILIV